MGKNPSTGHAPSVLTAMAFVAACGCPSCNDCGGELDLEAIPATFDASCFQGSAGAVRLESKPGSEASAAVHIGGDSAVDDIGARLEYRLVVPETLDRGVLELRYADDVAGNLVDVVWDGKRRGRIRTEGTGGWESFRLDRKKVFLGRVPKGTHALRIELARGGSWGVMLDVLRLVEVSDDDDLERGYSFVKSLVNPETGLIASDGYSEGRTTLYKNALAAFAFIHEGDLELAEAIFDFFRGKYAPPDGGLNQAWDSDSGEPGVANEWGGDIGFFQLALEYFRVVTGSYGRFEEMAQGLARWSIARAANVTQAEEAANLYCALVPFADSLPEAEEALVRLRAAFDADVHYDRILDHIHRGALCFSDPSGFAEIPRFERTEKWDFTGRKVTLLAADAGHDFSNVEISAQIFHAWQFYKDDVSVDLSSLGRTLDGLWLATGVRGGEVHGGLPYTVTAQPNWPQSSDEAIVDPTVYMLMAAWKLNPFAPDAGR